MNVWDEVKTKINILDIISEYVTIKHIGQSYSCVCPFHNDKNPSLTISPEKGLWHCFGCGAGGDVFRFVELIENLDKKGVLEKLAQKAGISLQSKSEFKKDAVDTQALSEFETGLKYLKWGEELYHKILLKLLEDRQHPVTQYCLERGLNRKIITAFSLGYAPKTSVVLNLASKHRMNQGILTKVGLLKTNQSGYVKDKFIDRLMIPIHDKQGHTVGFTGRVLPYDTSERPKYLNSSQSDWFNKSQIWFGWDLNSGSIRRQKKVIIVEGNMDVIAAWGKSFDYALASQGTSFSLDQLKQLRQLTQTVLLAFDNDEAGKTSARKFFIQASSVGLTVQQVLIPQEFKDLDQWLQSGKLESQELPVQPFLDAYLGYNFQALQSHNLQEQRLYISQALELIASQDELGREQYVQKLSTISKISLNTLKNLLEQTSAPSPLPAFDDNPNPKPEITAEQSKLVTFQNLIAHSSEFPQAQAHLTTIFSILRLLISELNSYPSFSDYLDSNQDMLQLIRQMSFDPNFLSQSWSILNHYIDQNLTKILLDPEIKEDYLTLRSLGPFPQIQPQNQSR